MRTSGQRVTARVPAMLAAALALAPRVAAAPDAAQAAPGPAAAPAEPEYAYPIEDGDTLFRLASSYLAGPRAVERVRRVNRIPASSLIIAGKTLRLPRSVLRDEPAFANVDSFSGEVVLRADGTAPLPAKMGLRLSEGSVIETGRRGFVSLRLADDSTVTIPSQSAVRIVRLRRVLINNAVEREFGTLAGRLRAKVTPMTDPTSSFRVSTPITVSAVRGTEFRVSFDSASDRALTEVEDGKVQVQMSGTDAAPTARPAASSRSAVTTADTPAPAATANSALVTPGFGTVAGRSGLGAITALLAPPRLNDPERAQTDPELTFAIAPDPAAAGYRIQIGRDAGLLDLVDEASGTDPRFVLGTLPTGTYFVRVAALDAQGAEGLGRTYAFDRVLNAVSGAASAEGRRYRFKWSSVADGTPQFRFRLIRKDQPDRPVVDEPMGTATELSVTALRPGEYQWQVLSLIPFGNKVIATWSAQQGFEVTARR